MGEVVSLLTYKLDKEARIIDEEEAQMERQYQEFISLLKYFLFIEEPKCYYVCLIFDDNGDFKLRDISYQEIEMTQENISFGSEFVFEDYLISTLIKLAPQKIEVFNTLKIPEKLREILSDVFEGKVSYSYKKDKLPNES